MNDSITKTCAKCGNVYPATNEHFYVCKRAKDGLQPQCKACCIEYYQTNRDAIIEKKREYRQLNKDKIAKYSYEYYQLNKDAITEYKREYQQKNKDAITEKHRIYRLENRVKRSTSRREYYQANQDKELEYAREYRRVNSEKHRELCRIYKQVNPDKMRILTQRRRARKQSLPDTFTEKQWIACLQYFDYSCAVCGISFENVIVHADHWIPLSAENCPGTIATNMICLCRDCNFSKHNKLPNTWLIERYDTDKVSEIIAHIESYFVYCS